MSAPAPEDWVTSLIGAIARVGDRPTLADLNHMVAVLAQRPRSGLPLAWQDVADQAQAWADRALATTVPSFRPGERYRAALDMPLTPAQPWQDRRDVA